MRLERLAPDTDGVVTDPFFIRCNMRAVFAASEQLRLGLARSPEVDELPAALRAEVLSEIARLSQYGFWPDAPSRDVPAGARVVSVGLHLAHACNLSCSYCNVDHGTYGGERSFMSLAVAEAALDLLAAWQREQGSPALLLLFGGEPTLNWDTLARTVRDFRARFSEPPHDLWLVTNGTMLSSERARFLAEMDVLSVVSLDGSAAVHDASRRFLSGGGSHAATIQGIRNLEAAGARHTVRGTWVPRTGDRLQQLAELRELAPRALQTTVAVDYHADAVATAEFNASVVREWDAFEASGYQGPAPASSAVVIDLILRGDWAPPMDCPAGVDSLSVAPSGDVYMCQIATMGERGKLGNVVLGGLDERAWEDLRRELDATRAGPACVSCPIRGFCRGPCKMIRPLLEPLAHCRLTQAELVRASRYAARVPPDVLASRYRVGLASAQARQAFERGAAIRQIAWQRNRHLRPLAICPTVSRQPESAGKQARQAR